MAITFQKEIFAGRVPEIWRGECKILPGGFQLDKAQAIPTGSILKRGMLVQVDFDEMTANVIKMAKVIDGGTTTKPHISKGSMFVVGDRLMAVGIDDKSPTISAINTSSSEYDELTLSSAITGLTAEMILIESTNYVAASGNDAAVPAKPLYNPNMVVGAELEFTGKGFPVISVAYEAVVLYPSLACPVPDVWLTGCCLAQNPNILFIKQ